MITGRPRHVTGPAFLSVAARLAGGVLLLAATLAGAQATSTANKTTEIAVFGGFTSVNPDYAYVRDKGLTFGASATRYLHFPVQPGMEARYMYTQGATVNESSFVGGPRGQMDFQRFHPYVDFLFGHGTIGYNFANPIPATPGGFVMSPGVGVDIDVFRNFQLKTDYQYQMWNLGSNYTLSPTAVTIGVTYRIPFKPRKDRAMH